MYGASWARSTGRCSVRPNARRSGTRPRPALGDDALARGKKNARRRRAWIVFQDESGVSQRPPVRRTWAPRGETPVLIHAFNWAKLSLAVGLAFRWDFRRSGLFFQTRPGSYNDVTLIGFLNELQDHFRGRRLLLIWDGLPSHKSRNMTAYLATQRSWLTIERLPGYALSSIPPNSCGATSRAANWPTSARTTSARSSGRSARVSAEFAGHPRWRLRFSAMPPFLFDQSVTVLRETQ